MSRCEQNDEINIRKKVPGCNPEQQISLIEELIEEGSNSLDPIEAQQEHELLRQRQAECRMCKKMKRN